MAKLTGQFTTPSLDAQNNKTHKPFLHGVVFVFTGTTKVTRETDAKGKYSFDLANGEYEVSVYLKGNTEKDRFDMRAGEKFTVTSATQADALEKWLQVIGISGKDELATYYENLLAQMQKMHGDTKAVRDEMVGNSVGSGEWMRKGAGGWCSMASQKAPSGHDLNNRLESGVYALFAGLSNRPSWQASGDAMMTFGWGSTYYIDLVFGTAGKIAISGTRSGRKSQWYDLFTQENTTVDSNGFIKAASPIIKLFNDRIEHSGFGDSEPIFEKLSTGTYKISNTLGLAQEGWTYEKPRGNDGQPYFRIVVEKLEDGCIVRVHDEYDTVEKAEITDIDGNTRTVDKIVKILGQARDIKEHERWIDLRFHEEPEEHLGEELLIEQGENKESY